MTALQVYYEGRVQGVGFRYTTRNIATGYDVTGWVRNLPDGRVEMLVNGEEEEVEAFLKGIEESVLNSFIKKTERRPAAAAVAGGKGFEIRE
jgi:acylphosphatase